MGEGGGTSVFFVKEWKGITEIVMTKDETLTPKWFGSAWERAGDDTSWASITELVILAKV